MANPGSREALEARARLFGEQLRETLIHTVTSNAEPFDYTVTEVNDLAVCTLRSAPQPRVQLYTLVEGERVPTFGLELEYKVFLGDFLTVQESSMGVGLGESNEPIFRYEYVRAPSGGIPTAHLHVHGHRDEFIHGMLLGSAKRPTRRLNAIRKRGLRAQFPTMSQVHFPLGGRRMRPGLEDLLELLILEFGVAPASEDWKTYLEGQRREWRELQLDTLISRNLDRVVEKLGHLGFEVRPKDGRSDEFPVGGGDPAMPEY